MSQFNDNITDTYSAFGDLLMSRIERVTCKKCGHTGSLRWDVAYRGCPVRPENPKCDRCGAPLC